MNPSFSVVVTTYNRSQLMQRAVNSVLAQSIPADEIIIVDDASADGTPDFVRKTFPEATFVALEKNGGPSVARNAGLAHARTQFVLCLDDDDILLPDAIETIWRNLVGLKDYDRFPVFQFSHSNGRANFPFKVVDLGDFCGGVIQGDFLPVIQRDVFLKQGLAYPSLRCGGEHLLWWDVADQLGIPTWDHVVCRVGTDAPSRLTGAKNQLSRPGEYAELQELTIQKFGNRLRAVSLATLVNKHMGAGTYWLLAGRRRAAALHIRELFGLGFVKHAILLAVLVCLPRAVIRRLFSWFRLRHVNAGHVPSGDQVDACRRAA